MRASVREKVIAKIGKRWASAREKADTNKSIYEGKGNDGDWQEVGIHKGERQCQFSSNVKAAGVSGASGRREWNLQEKPPSEVALVRSL
ncbi:hypothetical protein COCNU_14G010600 [Cocos nucifera]|uniref:Uncharacterized protein n=1 Tax=Cocos nucifera TaxID=13894 RepID=A0A8K0NCV2_COCNU|nr:hypothetical protein COCNU_14G010600 [Cocos nucifera]